MKRTVGYIVGAIGIILTIFGIIFKIKAGLSGMSISIPSFSDGPTAIFIAGTLGKNISLKIILVGVVLIIIAALLLKRKNNK